MTSVPIEERSVVLSNEPAGRSERRFALALVAASTLLFLALAPFAKTPLAPLPAFIPIYEAALLISDLLTAIFLLAQFNISRSIALLPLACGYLFTAFMAVPHALTFPGLFSPTGLLGAGPQSTAWLYMFWHGGFPLLVIAYARCRGWQRSARHARALILLGVAAALAAACGLTLIATLGQDILPAIMRENHYTPAMIVVVSGVWALSLLALLMLTRHRPYSILDVWLAVIMCAWLFDIALSAVLNAGRYDLGFYAGRIYGLLAASFVLAMLLLENSKLYVQLIESRASARAQAAELHRLSTVDPLTGIANRRAFEQALEQEWRRMTRHHTALSLLMIDVDFFKRFNDAYGHVAGDQCLRTVAQVLAARARRAGEVAARYGGEEFAVLLPHTESAEAHRLAELMCEAVRDQGIRHEASAAAPHVTVSIGVASAAPPRGSAAPSSRSGLPVTIWCSSPTGLVTAADRALYQAKAAGRDRAVSAGIDGDLPRILASAGAIGPARHDEDG